LAAKERNNRFCVACHLHEEKFARLNAPPAADLAGFHHGSDASVGCIACHGGADLLMRVEVWAVAGADTVRFLTGVYTEPRHMRLPLRDAECRRCHRPIVRSGPHAGPVAPARQSDAPASVPAADPSAEASYGVSPEAERGTSTNFHAIRDHITAESHCVRCHTSHTTDGDAQSRFLSPTTVRPICRECHMEMLGAFRAIR
jgi:nitrate/TMAO reductase-like tetraheme cytochrome c subunit